MLTEAAVIPYGTNFAQMKQDIRNGLQQPPQSVYGMGGIDRMGGSASFDDNLIVDIDVNVSTYCEQYPKKSLTNILADINQYAKRVHTRYKSVMTQRFWRMFYDTCHRQYVEFASLYGPEHSDYCISGKQLIINPMFLYEMFANKFDGEIEHWDVYKGMICD